MKTISEMYNSVRIYADKARSIYVANDHKGSPEYFRACQDVNKIVDNLDADLINRFRKAQKWVDQNHPIVGCNSTWSNCKGKEDIMLDYLGFNQFGCDRYRLNDEFKKSDVSAKTIIKDGFKYYQASLDRERDVLSAGGIDISSTDYMEKAIKTMLLSLDSYDEDLNLL